MVISIRRSRHEEGEELVPIWCRSVDATHNFCISRVSGRAGRAGAFLSAGSTVVGRG